MISKKESEIAITKMQPHDDDTEKAVLATLMRYNNLYGEYSDLLSEDLFYIPKNRYIYKCIEGVITGGGITDINSLYNYVKSNEGIEKVINRQDFVEIFELSNTNTFGQDVNRLCNMSKRRICWKLLQQASQKVLDLTCDFDEEVTGTTTALNDLHNMMKSDSVDSYDDALTELDGIIANNVDGTTQYLKTGFVLFDDYFILKPKSMTVLAAFTSVGKSSLALNIAMTVAKQGNPVAYYSLEMGKAELASRGISREMNIPSSVIMNKQLNENQIKAFNKIRDTYKGMPLYFDDRSTVSFDRTVRSIHMLAKTKGIKLAIIDYLQIYTQMSDDQERSTSLMARTLKNVAMELGISILLLSQLNRKDDHPTIKMLRGSGQIEESADNVILIDRPEAYPDNKVTKYIGEFKDESINGTAKLILAKGRGVGTSSTLVAFDKVHTRFFEIKENQTEKYHEHEDALPF
jgi:replicative DNA helicase